jgi:enediyne polyketide synthase
MAYHLVAGGLKITSLNMRNPKGTAWAHARSGAVLRAPAAIEAWPDNGPARAGVSAIGFGGINVHVAVEGIAQPLRRARAQLLPCPAQDAELLVESAAEPRALAARAQALAARVKGTSLAELADLACALASEAGHAGARAAVVASTPDEAREALEGIARAAHDDRPMHDGVHGRYYAGA